MMAWLTTALLVLTTEGQPATANLQTAIATQVALDRAGFSPGVIDGRSGANTQRALEAYRGQNGRDPEPSKEPLRKIAITPEDAAGPFEENIPADLMEQSKLPALGYRSVVEMLAERFHTDEKVLRTLNPDAAFASGEEILVPNVEPMVMPAPPLATAPHQSTGTSGRHQEPGVKATPERTGNVVRVGRAASALTVTAPDGTIVFFAPVTTGSEHDPLPIGEWKVNGVQFNPTFRYNPDLFWDADPSHTKAKIPAGPNNPVGLVWIDISKDHYGLHGAPEPSQIGKTASHGCVRLTNWDALRLAALVQPGTRVLFTE